MKMRETDCESEKCMGLTRARVQLWAIGPSGPVQKIRHIIVVSSLLATL
jgi:hypothetical protein